MSKEIPKGSTYRLGSSDPEELKKVKSPIGFNPLLRTETTRKEEPSGLPSESTVEEGPVASITTPTAPEQPPVESEADLAPEVPIEQPVESVEHRSVKEILMLQEEAFSARREMIAFRHGKKVVDLTPEQQSQYKQLKEASQAKREVWMAELDKLPEDQQDELKDLTKLKEVQDRLATMTPEQVVTSALEATLDSYKDELTALEAEIQEMERLIRYDKDTVRSVTALGNEDDLKALKARRKALVAKIASMSDNQAPSQNDLAGEAEINPEPSIPASEVAPTSPPVAETAPRPVLDYERDRAEAKARRLELLRASINEVDKKILAKTLERDAFPAWNVIGKMRTENEQNKLLDERRRLDREMNERQGFGAKFKEMATKAYHSVKSRLKFERSRPIGIGDLRGGPEPIAPIGQSAEIEEETGTLESPVEQVEETGTWGKWLKQRLVGFGTLAWREVRPAETFRTGTKDVAKDLGSMSRLVESERDLSRDNAQEEANKIVAKLRAEGIETAGDPRFMEISAEITEQRIARNNAKIDEIVLAQMDQLEQKLKGYKGDFGQDVLTEENKNKIATEMRARLVAMRSGQAEADVKEMTGMLRGNLDSKWWRRYVYAGIDAVLWGLVIKYVAGKFMATKAKEAFATKAVGAGSKEVTQVVIKDTIWGEAKRQLIGHGVANPTNTQIQQVALKFAQDSSVKVVAKGGGLLWPQTAAGVFKDVALGKGFIIKMAGGLKQIATIKAGMIAGAL